MKHSIAAFLALDTMYCTVALYIDLFLVFDRYHVLLVLYGRLDDRYNKGSTTLAYPLLSPRVGLSVTTPCGYVCDTRYGELPTVARLISNS